jgi:hypothetical protein
VINPSYRPLLFILSGRDELKSCLAHTEAVIDFGDDDRENDIDDSAMWTLVPRVKALQEMIQRSLSDDKKGEILRDGVQITLVGLPNAGAATHRFTSHSPRIREIFNSQHFSSKTCCDCLSNCWYNTVGSLCLPSLWLM